VEGNARIPRLKARLGEPEEFVALYRRESELILMFCARRAMALMACGDAHDATAPRQTAINRHRLRARRTLDLIAAHAASVVPVCPSHVSLQP
jgi:hypothetical protein